MTERPDAIRAGRGAIRRPGHIVAMLIAALAVASITVVSFGGHATAAEAPAAQAPGDASDDAGGRLTWGVVPSGPEGPTDRSRFDLEVDPGEELIEHVAIINYTVEDLTLDVYAQDAFTTATGEFDILPAVETSTGAGTWIDVGARSVTVPPRSRVDLPFRIAVPPRATPGDHAAGIVASLTSESVDDAGNRFAVDNRVGARVYLRVAGDLDPQLSVAVIDATYEHQLNPLGRGTVTFTYSVANTGNVRLASRPTVATSWLFGWLRHATDGQTLPELLPGEIFTATTELPTVAPLVWLRGQIDLIPIPPESIDAGGPAATASALATVWAVPWSAIVIVVVTLLAVYLIRRRRAGAEDPDDEDPDADPIGVASSPTSDASSTTP